MNKRFFLLIASLLVAVSAFAGGGKDSEEKPGVSMMAADPKKSDAMKADAMMSNGKAISKSPFDLSGLEPSAVAFTGEEAAMKLAAENTVVYFFAASWCPTCAATWKDVVANKASLPANFRLIFVNYDTEKALKAKYAITYQHTYVRIDPSGKALKTWSGSATVADILKNAAGS